MVHGGKVNSVILFLHLKMHIFKGSESLMEVQHLTFVIWTEVKDEK